MKRFDNSVQPIIASVYDSLTLSEQQIADFFLQDQNGMDLSSKAISKRLFVSEASLTRFAKKCGYTGYREFIYEYSIKNPIAINHDQLIRNILHHYQRILSNGYQVMNEQILAKVAHEMLNANKVFVYGIGSSGIAACEMKYRFMRLGIDIEAITDIEIMKMNRVNLKKGVVLIGLSLSGSRQVISNIRIGKDRGASTVLVTTNTETIRKNFIDYEIIVPSIRNIEIGNVLSPLFPHILAIDVLYAYSLLETPELESVLQQTISKSYKESHE